MNKEVDLFAVEAITKKLNQIKQEYHNIDFKNSFPQNYAYSNNQYCKEFIFYVPGLNALYKTKTNGVLHWDFITNGGVKSLTIDQLEKVDVIPYHWQHEYTRFFDKHLHDDFVKDHPYSGIEEIEDLSYTRYGYIEGIEKYAMYAACYLENPQIEKLIKTDLRKLVVEWMVNPSVLFKRNFKSGKNLNEITRLPKYAWQMMMKEDVLTRDIKAWNEMRIWVQKDNLTKDQLQTILNLNIYDSNQIKELRTILGAEWEGKKLFTIETLLNYLGRLDMYQAINVPDALTLLRDYIHMCGELNIKPITDSNSLKREHDVTLRQYNEHRFVKHDKKLEEGFKERAPILAKYEYTDGRLQVVAPRTAEDVRNEGRNNRNCVGSYAARVAKGQTNIFFIRQCDYPEKSYITIEVDDEFTKVRQKYYGANRPIDKKEDLEFIDQWIEHNARVPMLDVPEIEEENISVEELTDVVEPVAVNLEEKVKEAELYKVSANKNGKQKGIEQYELQLEF